MGFGVAWPCCKRGKEKQTGWAFPFFFGLFSLSCWRLLICLGFALFHISRHYSPSLFAHTPKPLIKLFLPIRLYIFTQFPQQSLCNQDSSPSKDSAALQVPSVFSPPPVLAWGPWGNAFSPQALAQPASITQEQLLTIWDVHLLLSPHPSVLL